MSIEGEADVNCGGMSFPVFLAMKKKMAVC